VSSASVRGPCRSHRSPRDEYLRSVLHDNGKMKAIDKQPRTQAVSLGDCHLKLVDRADHVLSE